MGTSEQPLGPRRLDFRDLTADDFERLCYFIIQLEFPEAVRLEAPDGGADIVLPEGPGRGYRRCWQAKRFTGHIRWGQCCDSLDDAVPAYGMLHYTFCFARDLTGSQEKTFKQKFAGRHEALGVDYWGQSRLESTLFGSPGGARIANHFWGKPAVSAAEVVAAINAGGLMTTGATVFERLEAVANWLAAHDPNFSYATTTREVGVQPTPLHQGTVLSLETGGPGGIRRIDAIPRHAEAIERYGPSGQILFETNSPEGKAALAAFQAAMSKGHPVDLEKGVKIRMAQVPALFRSLIPEETAPGTRIRVTPSGPLRPAPWRAHLVADTDTGTGEVDLEMAGVEPSDGWDAALKGTSAGLTMTLELRRTEGGGEAVLAFVYETDHTLPVRDQLAAISMLISLHGRGVLRIEDLDAIRPDVALDTLGGELPEYAFQHRQLLDDLRVIETWAGHTFSMPESISGEEMVGIAQSAHMIRHQTSAMSVEHLTVEVSDETYRAHLSGETGPARYEMEIKVMLFGEEVELGRLVGEIPDVSVASAEPIANSSPPSVLVRLEPTTAASRHPTFRLER